MKIRLFSTTLTFLMLILIQGSILAQQSSDFSLKQAQDYALLNNSAMKNSNIDLELAKKKIWETTAIGLPQVNAQANYQHLFTVPELSFGGITFLNTNLPAGTPITADDISNESVFLDYTPAPPIPLGIKDNTTLDVTVTQLIFSGEYLVGLQASRAYYMFADQNKQRTEIEIRQAVANAYITALMVQSTYDVLAQMLEGNSKLLNESREYYNQGFIEKIAVEQIELNFLTLENGVRSAERGVNGSKNFLKYIIGYPIEKEISLTDNLELLAQEVNLESLVSNGFKVQNNINYKLAQTQVKFAQLNLKREKSTVLPNLAAVYRHTEKFKKIDFDFQPNDVFALSLNIPIFSSGQRYVKIQQRRLELDKAENMRSDALQGMELEYRGAMDEMNNAYENYTNVKRNLELTRSIYDKTVIKFNEGISSSSDLTIAQNQLLAAQTQYITTLNSILTAKNRLTKLTNNQ
jgi:outer membrane protein